MLPRRSPALKSVSAPLSSTPLSRLIYVLITLSILLISYYSYRGLQYKSAVGGWWNMALGKKAPCIINGARPSGASPAACGDGEEESVEDRINGLARMLGMPSKELASAIAGAVRQYVPPASLSSVAAKETGEVVEALLKDGNEKEEDGVLHSIVSSFVGLGEDELDS